MAAVSMAAATNVARRNTASKPRLLDDVARLKGRSNVARPYASGTNPPMPFGPWQHTGAYSQRDV